MKILLIHDTFFTLEGNLSCIRKLICGRLCWFMIRFLYLKPISHVPRNCSVGDSVSSLCVICI